jgi:glycosyltransferase involved in cell wall biosynthesis
VESPQFEDGPWPKITVVTPSYQQGAFLEQTIRSVLLQGYPNLEYFVLDGGSTDESRASVEKYAPWLAGWRCEKDQGQAATVNEGWRRGTGEILAWINSDDWYQPGAFAAVAPLFRKAHPVDWVSGFVDDCNADGTFLRRHPARATPLAEALGFHRTGYYQPGMFWSRALVDKVGPLDASQHLCFDLDFWARSLAAGFVLTPMEQPVACFRQHGASKSSSRLEAIVAESRDVFARYAGTLPSEERRQSGEWLRAYLSDMVLHIVYGHLQAGRKAQASEVLLREWRTAMALRPHKLALGLFYHVFVRGCPPAWFSEQNIG